ncbi:MAG TPA: dihydrodipicolinate synthase family protein [Steroidobacteraceae bacterium]|jgi:4-hydroxy-tetrahydrodipicolinate synthase|nr:dihydrodipicolinate synthase family protein [Steroidobacteraceae bacterium]
MDRSSVDWRGYIPAITTPFTRDRQLDGSALQELLEWLAAEGMHGIVLAGTTGEWFSLSDAERRTLLSITGRQLRGRLTLIAGCNAYGADRVIEYAEMARESGFDGILLTPPPYIVPNEEEIFAFYRHVSQHVRLPICVYNWPPGTNVDMSCELLERLAGLDRIVAVKNSTGRLDRFIQSFFALKDRLRVFGFSMDELGATLLRTHGGDGTMGAGAVLGRDHPDFYNHLWRGDVAAALRCGARDRVLMKEWFTENLVGRFGSAQAILKEALNAQGLPGGYPRPPILELTEAAREQVRDTLRRLGRIHV